MSQYVLVWLGTFLKALLDIASCLKAAFKICLPNGATVGNSIIESIDVEDYERTRTIEDYGIQSSFTFPQAP